MPTPVGTNVTARLESFRRDGITRREVRQVFREARVAGFSPNEVRAFREAATRLGDDFTADGAVELRRITGLRLRGDGTRASEFSLLPNLTSFERNPGRWGASSALDPRLPTFEKKLPRSALPAQVVERVRAEGERQMKRNLGPDTRERLASPFDVAGLYDLEHRLVGYRVSVRLREPTVAAWPGAVITTTREGRVQHVGPRRAGD